MNAAEIAVDPRTTPHPPELATHAAMIAASACWNVLES
jgi:hypothetical protein